jgi:hypothetical protein
MSISYIYIHYILFSLSGNFGVGEETGFPWLTRCTQSLVISKVLALLFKVATGWIVLERRAI